MQVGRLEVVVPPLGSGRDRDGDFVLDEVADEAEDARERSDVRPREVLQGATFGDVVVDGDGDARVEGEEVFGGGSFGCEGSYVSDSRKRRLVEVYVCPCIPI